MPQIIRRNIKKIMILFIALIAAAGCSDGNSKSVFDSATGKHPDNWLTDHGASYMSNPDQCTECHGTDLKGGVSGVSCYTASYNGMSCHANGPGGHSPGWSDPDLHGASAKAAPDTATGTGFSSCQVCHGTDFTGGLAQTTCLNTAICHGTGVEAPHSPSPWRGSTRTHTNTDEGNASVCYLCHQTGQSGTPSCFNNTLCHGSDVSAPHPVPYTDSIAHGPAAKADLTYCEECHANPPDGGPGSNPRFNVSIGNLTNGCEDCHEPYTAHPVPWLGPDETSHQTAGNMANACALCHGADLSGGVGPACSTCHTEESPLTAANCTSCHSKPPAGSVYPGREGAHTEHNALTNVTGVCNTCHNGAGSGTVYHYDGLVEVVFSGTTYNAKSGTVSYNAASVACSNISCHGGQTTSSWLSGTIDVNTDCTVCHTSGTTQYNSYSSGDHSKHINAGIFCYECHDTAKLPTNHFTNLNTTAMTGAALTIIDAANYSGGKCTINCHTIGGDTKDHNGLSW